MPDAQAYEIPAGLYQRLHALIAAIALKSSRFFAFSVNGYLSLSAEAKLLMKTKTLLFLPLILAVCTAPFAPKLEAQIPQPLLYLSFEEADPWQDQSATINAVNVEDTLKYLPSLDQFLLIF